MFKVDLHTHSVASPDGGISAQEYKDALDTNLLDAIAVTDHNSIDFALALKESLGDRIIVGEEIMTTHGEIVGLFLTKLVPAGLSPLDTIRAIKDQNGLVYIPHPFETIRKGIDPKTLDDVSDYVDIIEVCNGRAFTQNRSSQAVVWSRLNTKESAASSDAHGFKGLGKTYSNLQDLPSRDNLLGLLNRSTLHTAHPSLRALLYPKYHRLKKRFGKG